MKLDARALVALIVLSASVMSPAAAVAAPAAPTIQIDTPAELLFPPNSILVHGSYSCPPDSNPGDPLQVSVQQAQTTTLIGIGETTVPCDGGTHKFSVMVTANQPFVVGDATALGFVCSLGCSSPEYHTIHIS